MKVDKKVIVMLRQKQKTLTISVSNPMHCGLTPSFIENTSKTIGELYETPVNVTLTNIGAKDENNNEITVSIELPTDRGYEGQTSSKSIQLKEGGGFKLISSINMKKRANRSTIRPNPVDKTFEIHAQEGFKKAMLFDSTGVLLSTLDLTQNTTMEFADRYEKGIYILKLTGSSGEESHKIIKK